MENNSKLTSLKSAVDEFDLGGSTLQDIINIKEDDLANTSIVQDGTTSVSLDTDLLETAAGLTLAGNDNTVEPASEEFALGFDITEESNFIFNFQEGFSLVGGEIEHTGTVSFESGAGEITVGDLTIGFDSSRQTENTSGFFVQNNVDGAVGEGTILFDVGNPENIEANASNLDIETSDLLVSSEFADVLQSTGLSADNLTGADVGDVTVNAIAESLLETSCGDCV